MRLKLDEDRLEFERWKGEEDAIRVRRAQNHDAKVLALNEKRIELKIQLEALDREQRKSALDQRKHKITVLGSIAEKLK